MRLSGNVRAPWRKDGRGTNFALFSANAEKVELCLFDPGPARAPNGSVPEDQDIWRSYLNTSRPASSGIAFVLTLPNADTVSTPTSCCSIHAKRMRTAGWSDAHFAYRTGSARGVSHFDRATSPRACQAVVVDETSTGAAAVGANREDTIIYEAHVKAAQS